jgi:predicted small secreted protein
MKKLMALVLVAVLALSLLTACKVNVNEGGGNSDIDFGAIMNGGAGNYNNLSPKEKQAVIDAGKKEGIDVKFEKDGSVSFSNPNDNTMMVQNPDGSWNIGTPDGGGVQIGRNWPDNEFTKLIPKPDFTVSIGAGSEDNFNVMFSGATIEQIRAYAEKVKNAGFDIDVKIEDESAMGMVIYTFDAKNADGYSVNVFSAAGMSGVTIEKPY